MPQNAPIIPERRHLPVPTTIPGERVTDERLLAKLRLYVNDLCQLNIKGFPGSQPVSFTSRSLDLLEEENFWVCEKSDGIRALLFIARLDPQVKPQEVFLIDRRNDYYRVEGLRFPSPLQKDNKNIRLQKDTIVDGEIVIDVDRHTGKETLRYLAFDCLVCEGRHLLGSTLDSRYGNLRANVVKPWTDLVKRYPQVKEKIPFEIRIKPVERAYGISAVFQEHVPKLEHGSDGLIFTCSVSPYTPGTDNMILKWKPPSENSIDFRLRLVFPPSKQDVRRPNFKAKPLFVLMENCGRRSEEPFDLVEVSDEQWEQWKASREQIDGRVVEVVWESTIQSWKVLRFRDDKKEGNFTTIIKKIIVSIQDGVQPEQLIERAPAVRQGWIKREEEQKRLKDAWEADNACGPAFLPLEEVDVVARTKIPLIL